MHWLLIEGDNGTGKDTVREHFERQGWVHVNDSADALTELEVAIKRKGPSRIPAYLQYCQACGSFAARTPGNRVSVRYWPSTLSAGYADELIGFSEMADMLEKCICELPSPNSVIELRCDFDARIARILERMGRQPNLVDNIDRPRAMRIREAVEYIASRWSIPWLILDTTHQKPHKVYEAASSWINEQRKG